MIVFGTVVYLGALGYLEELIESINQQTIKDFDVLIINDDVEKTLLDSYLKKINNVNVYVVDRMQSGKTPAELRVDLLSEAKKKGYELLVIGDCDDTFASNRIEKVYDAFLENNNYGFYYNDLVLAESNDSIFSMPLETTAINDILQYNYLGMSNNAVNLRELSVEWIETLRDCESFVFDWYLFSRLLLFNQKGIHVKDTATVYRIHQNNFAGLNNCSKELLEKELMVKRKHYKMLAPYSEILKDLYEKIVNLTVETVSLNSEKKSFWWSNIVIGKDENYEF